MILKKLIRITSIIWAWVYGYASCHILDMIKPIRVSFESVLRRPTHRGMLKYILATSCVVLVILILNIIARKDKNSSVKKSMIINAIAYTFGLLFFLLFQAPLMSGTDCA